MYPSFPSLRMVSRGKVCASSHSMTCGRISASANSRTDLRSWICSGVYWKSTGDLRRSDDLFGGRVPAHGAALPVALHRHPAGDRNAEAHVGRAARLGARADTIEEILHVGVGRRPGRADHLFPIRPVHLLRQIANLL